MHFLHSTTLSESTARPKARVATDPGSPPCGDVSGSCATRVRHRICLFGCASRPSGGADRDRTDDPRLAKPMLSQLSYSPVEQSHRAVGAARFELATPRLSSVCSNQLSYAPSRSSVCRRQDTMSVQRPGMLRSPITENRVAGRSGLTASPKRETCR